MKKNNKSLLVWGFVVPLAVACSPSVSAFAHEKLKGLAEQLQKNLPAPPKNGEGAQPSGTPAMKNFQSGPAAKSGNTGKLGFCSSETAGFGIRAAKTFNVADPEALVKQYFDVDPTTATVQLKSYLFDYRNPVIGTSFVEAVMDGGILSSEARALGVQLIKDPSISSLAQLIAAAGQEKKGFGAVEMQVPESKAVLALVALQLEPILKDKGLVSAMLKDSRETGKFMDVSPVESPFAYALSARHAYIRNNDQNAFTNFLNRSLQDLPAELEKKGVFVFNKARVMTERTRRMAIEKRISNGEWVKREQQGQQIMAELTKGQVAFNDAGWNRAYDQTLAEQRRLDELVLSSFKLAQTQSQAASAGLEQARKSAELEKYGVEENPDVTRAGQILALGTPKFADAEKKAALAQALRDRFKLNDQIDRLDMRLFDATMSGSYSYQDLGDKKGLLNDMRLSTCLVVFAQEAAAKAADVALPDPNDNKAEDDFLRG